MASQNKRKRSPHESQPRKRDQGIKSEPKAENKAKAHTYAQGEGVDHRLTTVKRAHSTSATALQWQVHVRIHANKEMRTILHAKNIRLSSPRTKPRGESERGKPKKKKRERNVHGNTGILSQGKSHSTQSAQRSVDGPSGEGGEVRNREIKANDPRRQRNSQQCRRERFGEAKKQGPENKGNSRCESQPAGP